MFQIKKEKYINKTLRLNETLIGELTRYALQNNISINALVSQCCQYALNQVKSDEESEVGRLALGINKNPSDP